MWRATPRLFQKLWRAQHSSTNDVTHYSRHPLHMSSQCAFCSSAFSLTNKYMIVVAQREREIATYTTENGASRFVVRRLLQPATPVSNHYFVTCPLERTCFFRVSIHVFNKEGEERKTRATNIEELQEKVKALKALKGWYLIVDFGHWEDCLVHYPVRSCCESCEACRSKKIHVKERIKKKGLKHKLAKGKKKAERKMNKVLVKPQKSPPEPLTEPKLEKITKAPKPVFNSQGKMVFSKFDFSEMGAQGTGGSALKSKGPKSPGKILQKIQRHKEKLQQLESEGKMEAAQELKQKEAWRSALRKAQGEKVKDDPLLLKKSVRKIKDRKKQSTDKWAARNEHVNRTLEERQHKRNANIQKRKKEVKLKKIKKAVKKGRIIPGH
uniref:Ribosomal RNA-processing protein 14/surfeit locus protein 6 C-terminal domain-containing protein n=1 Tax=Timema tahoe TaxID=61484 RepID=A0A7R9IGQ7_9NEOP|nr:unnamed protein product [Timema tahoe]